MTNITVTKTFTDAVGGQLNGTVTFTPIMTAPDQSALVVVSEPTSAVVVNGALSKVLLTTDSYNVSGVVTYRVVERVGSTIRTRYYVELPSTLGDTVDLGSLQTWSSPPNTTVIDPANLAAELDAIRQQIGDIGNNVGIDLSPYVLYSDAVDLFSDASHTHPTEQAAINLIPNGSFVADVSDWTTNLGNVGSPTNAWSATSPISTGGALKMSLATLTDVSSVSPAAFLKLVSPNLALAGSVDVHSTKPCQFDIEVIVKNASSGTFTYATNDGILKAGSVTTTANVSQSIRFSVAIPTTAVQVRLVVRMSAASGATLPVDGYLDNVFASWSVGSASNLYSQAHGVQAGKSAVQSIATGTSPIKVTLPDATLDRGGYLDKTNNRITIPSEHSGPHTFTANVEYASNATGLRRLYLYKNGTAIASTLPVTPISGEVTPLSLTWQGDLKNTDYLEVFTYQSSGGNLNLNNTNFNVSCWRQDVAPASNVSTPAVPPTAGFTRTPSTGTAPVTVVCTSTATGDISSIEYDFGAGAGYGTASSYTYTAAYSGNITQRVTGPGGVVTTTQSVTISGVVSGAKPLVRSMQSTAAVAGATSVTAALPTGDASGDLLVLFYMQRTSGASTITGPAGWTQLATVNSTGEKAYVWYKTATGSDTDPVVTSTSTNAAIAVAYCITTASWRTADPFSGTIVTTDSLVSQGSLTVDALTMDDTSGLRIGVASHLTGSTLPTMTAPSGWVDDGTIAALSSSGTSNLTAKAAHVDVSASGATGTALFDSTGNNVWLGVQIGVNASNVSQPPPPDPTGERFPGDPGVGKLYYTHIQHGGGYDDWKTAMTQIRGASYPGGSSNNSREAVVFKRYGAGQGMTAGELDSTANNQAIADGRIIYYVAELNGGEAAEAAKANGGNFQGVYDDWAVTMNGWRDNHNGVVFMNFLHEPEGNSDSYSGNDAQRASARTAQRVFVKYMRTKGVTNMAFIGPVFMNHTPNSARLDWNNGSPKSDPWWTYYPDWKGTYTGWTVKSDGSGLNYNPADFWTSGPDRVVDVAGLDPYCWHAMGGTTAYNPAKGIWQWSYSLGGTSETDYGSHDIFTGERNYPDWTNASGPFNLHAGRYRDILDDIYGTGTNRMPILLSEWGWPIYETDSYQHGVNPDLTKSLEHWMHMYDEMVDNDVITTCMWQYPKPPGQWAQDTFAVGVHARYSQNNTNTVGGTTYTGTGRKSDPDPNECRLKAIAKALDQTTTIKALRK